MSADGFARAFLSHASENKPFVDKVAEKLGRQFCLYDKHEFASGVEFAASIDQALDRSNLFVLFVSTESLKKLWVNYEMSEAVARKIRGSISRMLVYVIDSSVSIDDIPPEFKRAKVEFGLNPSQVTRDIIMHSEDLLRGRSGRYYVGRGADHDEFATKLLARVDGRAPNVFVVVGLPGVGRREFIQRAARDALSLRKGVQVRVGEGDTIQDFAIQLTDATGGFADIARFAAEAARVRSLSDGDAQAEIVRLIVELTANSELPIIMDAGGVFTNEATLVGWFSDLIASVIGRRDAALALVSTRKPVLAHGSATVYLRLNHIGTDATKLLVSQHASDPPTLALTEAQIAELAEYVRGYPPAAYYAIQQAKEYGVDLILSNKERLVEFRRKIFYDYLDSLKFEKSATEIRVLRLLSVFSPLPLAAIGGSLNLTAEKLVPAIVTLIDLCLVNTDDGLYRISDPVSEAATKHFGLPAREEARAVAASLSSFLSTQDVANRRLDVSRAMFRAARLGGDEGIAASAVRLTSDLVSLVEQLYHQRRWEEAAAAGLLAMEEAPRADRAMSYLIRSYVQLEKWGNATEWMQRYSALAPNRDYLFLRAFMAKRQGHIRDAIGLYEQALQAGRSGGAISRELSHCYMLVEDFPKAKQQIDLALHHEPDNRFVVDMWAAIAARLGERTEVENALKRLEVVDERMFYLFRKARVHWVFGEGEQSLADAREALALSDNPPFHLLAHLAMCEQVVGDRNRAEELVDRLDKDFKLTKKDIRIGLRTRLLLSKGLVQEAKALLDETAAKRGDSYDSLKRDVYLALVNSASLDEKTKAAYRLVLEALPQHDSASRPDIAELDIR